MFKVIPQPGFAVVRPMPSDDFNKSELAQVENDKQERIATGEVLAVSKFAGSFENFGFQISTDVKAGDIICYQQYTEHPVRVNGEEIHLVRWDKITATLKETK